MEQRQLDEWFSFLGYGCPDSLLWFVGIEPGGDQAFEPMPPQDKYRFNNMDLLYDKNIPEDKNRVWNVSKELASICKQDYFMSNIAPLPRPNENIKLVGINNIKDYRARVISERVPRLKSIHESNPKRVTVFHGAGARSIYKVLEAFDLNLNDSQREDTGLIIYETKRLIFTHNFSRGYSFPNSNVKYVSSLLNKWLLSEPI